jgi:hypothetical protein
VCTVAFWFVGWGALGWRSDVKAGRVLGREEDLLVHCAFVLPSGLGGARPRRFLHGGRCIQGCCCAVSLLFRSDPVGASASSSG